MKHTRRNQKKIQTKAVLYLRHLRIQKGLSIRIAARLLGRSSSWLNHLEQGRFDPKDADLELVCGLLGISVKELKRKISDLKEDDILDLRAELKLIIGRLSQEKLAALYAIVRQF